MNIYMKIKRMGDIFLALSSLIVLGIPFLLISVLIKVETDGPVFYSEERIGKCGKVFRKYRYRTTIDTLDGNGKVTIIGKFLKKINLDEIPQILNIIKGDMSIIGPAAPLLSGSKEYGKYSEYERKKFEVLPGTTGLSQIVLGEDGNFEETLELDIEYVENMSSKLDTEIFLKTIFTSIRGVNN